MRNWTGFTAAALLAVALSACGGGGDDGGNEAGKDTGFQLSASLDGTPVTGFALKDGGSTTLNIASGQELRLSASNGVTWTASMEKTTIQPKSQNSAVWDAVLISPEGGTVTLVAKSAADASKLATIRIEVPPHRYARVAAKVGETTLWREQGTTVDGSPTTASAGGPSRWQASRNAAMACSSSLACAQPWVSRAAISAARSGGPLPPSPSAGNSYRARTALSVFSTHTRTTEAATSPIASSSRLPLIYRCCLVAAPSRHAACPSPTADFGKTLGKFFRDAFR